MFGESEGVWGCGVQAEYRWTRQEVGFHEVDSWMGLVFFECEGSGADAASSEAVGELDGCMMALKHSRGAQ